MNSKITSIQVLGPGCPNCKKLYELTTQAVRELGLTTTVDYIDDIKKMIELGIMSTPVLTINNKIALAGQVPNIEKIKELLTSDIEPATNISTGSCSCGGTC